MSSVCPRGWSRAGAAQDSSGRCRAGPEHTGANPLHICFCVMLEVQAEPGWGWPSPTLPAFAP